MILGSTGSIGTPGARRAAQPPRRLPRGRAGRGPQRRGARRAGRRVRARRPTRARLCGDDAAPLEELAAHPDADVVLNAVVGFAGLPATLSALRHGKRLALANKESLIAGGPVVAKVRAPGRRRDRARSTPSTPRSTSACASGARRRCSRLVVTASGGPFRGRTRAELAVGHRRSGARASDVVDGRRRSRSTARRS